MSNQPTEHEIMLGLAQAQAELNRWLGIAYRNHQRIDINLMDVTEGTLGGGLAYGQMMYAVDIELNGQLVCFPSKYTDTLPQPPAANLG